MRDLLFPSSPAHRGALRESGRLQARAFVMECRAIVGMFEAAEPEQREFVHGDVAGTLHLAPRTAQDKLDTALSLMAQPRLVAALEHGRLGVGHAMAVLHEISHLDAPTASLALAAVLGDGEDEIDATAGELRSAVKKAAAAMTFDDPDLTEGQKQVAAALHALGCERTSVQAVLECPVDRAVDLHAAAQAGVWSVDVRMPVAVALGLSDHPALLAGYGPIGADQARALLPRYVPSEALGRLVDLRDVTSTFPGDATSARRTDRDHRLPYPLGPTDACNLQNVTRRWHRAKHSGWHTRQHDDGSIRWTSPSNGIYTRRPKRTVPPKIPPGSTLPPLCEED